MKATMRLYCFGFAMISSLCTVDARAGWTSYSGPNMTQVAVTDGLVFGVGSLGASNYGQQMFAFTSGRGSTFGEVDACIAPAFSGNTFFTGSNHIEAIGVSDHYIGQTGQPPNGYFEVWVLGTDGSVYKTYGNGGCAYEPNASNVPVPWQRIITPFLTGTGTRVFPTRIAPTWSASGGYLWMVDSSNRISSNNWHGGWNASGNSPTTIQTLIYNDNSQIADDYVDALGTSNIYVGSQGPVPGLPQNVHFNQPLYTFGGRGQPLSHGGSPCAGCKALDVWAATDNGGANAQNIYRSQFVGGAYSAWQVYQTGPLLGNPALPLAWSVVDATSYRGIRGDIFVVGAYGSLCEYLP